MSRLQVSAASIFAPTQVGWATAPVLLRFDDTGAANSGFWEISLNRETLVVTIDYNDLDLAGGRRTWTTTPDK